MNTIEGIDQKKIDEKISLVSAVTAVSLLASQQAGADQNDIARFCCGIFLSLSDSRQNLEQ